MNWLRLYRVRSFLRDTVWLMPCLGILAAQLLIHTAGSLDFLAGWKAEASIDGDRAAFGAVAASMLTFIVFLFSMLLVVVQLASAQLSPRIIAMTFRDVTTKIALTLFAFTFVISLSVVRRIDVDTPQILVWVGKWCSIASMVVYLYMIDHVGKNLRPVSLLTHVAEEGRAVIEAIYPHRLAESNSAPEEEAATAEGGPSRVIEHGADGVLLAFDQDGLVEIARRGGCVIELIPQVGDFVAKGSPLIRVRGAGEIDEGALWSSLAFGPERTMEQDPTFAFRIIVDIASKALSAAINDPTTAVLALDQLQQLLRTVGMRRLDTGRICDAGGRLRLIFRTPDWEDFVGMAVTEIRHFGKDSIQVARRMRAMLQDLLAVLPDHRTVRLREELELLQRSVERGFLDPEDRGRANVGDAQGLGGSQRP